MRRRRRLMSLGELGGELVQRMDPQGLRHKARVVAAWPSVAGAEVAAHTRGLSLRSGELVIFVDSPVWGNELALMSEEYRRRLNEEAGEDLVRKMRFVVSKKARDATTIPGHARPERAIPPVPPKPLGETEQTQIRHAAAPIKDDDLKEAAVRAMTRDLERRRTRGENAGEASPPSPGDAV